MLNRTIAAVGLLVISLCGAPSAAAQHATMPPGMTHEEHLAQLKKRGAQAMGFDQDTTAHHFRLTQTGGIIDVAVRNAADQAGREAVRSHLRQIAADFAAGNFEKPLATHGELPPGVPQMQRLQAKITYTFEESPGGGLVRIASADRSARDAIHQFLRYQIAEHQTGDSLSVAK